MVEIPAYERNVFIVKCLKLFWNLLGCDLQSDVLLDWQKKNGLFLAELVELKKKCTGEI